MLARKVWIPSKNKYFRIKELSTIEYKNLLKIIDENDEFVLYINQYIENFLTPKLDLGSITIVDRFIIFVYLKIYSCGKDLNFTKICESCNTSNKITIDVNKALDDLAPVIDKSFITPFPYNRASIICDIPSAALYDAMMANNDSLDDKLNNVLFSFINRISLSPTESYNLGNFSIKNFELYKHIDYKTMLLIKEQFIDRLFNSFSSLNIFKVDCTSCNKELFNLEFNMMNMIEIIKMIFSDDSLENVLYTLSDLNSMYHFDYRFYENTTPIELNILLERLAKKQEGEQKQEDMFNPENMIESPSEFQ